MNILVGPCSIPCYKCCKDFLEYEIDIEIFYCPTCGFVMGNNNEISSSHYLVSEQDVGVNLHDIGRIKHGDSMDDSYHLEIMKSYDAR